MKECTICCGEVLEKDIVQCSCLSEKTITCKLCAKNYILSSDEPHCMHCKTKWSTGFLYDNFKRTWIEGLQEGCYRHYYKNKLLDIEKTKIPETLSNIIVEREYEKYKNKASAYLHRLYQYKSIRDNLTQTCDKIIRLNKQKGDIESFSLENHSNFVNIIEPNENDNISCINNIKYEELTNIINTLTENIQNIQSTREFVYYKSFSNKNKRIVTFICPCPNENCNSGLISIDNLSCASCGTKICKHCREIVKDNKKHVCDKNIVENIKGIRSNTKPCPKCAISIYKIEGCDQIWCTQCKVAFSWKTGKLETGVLHNPHAIQWMRENGGLNRDINDVPCGGLIELNHIKYIVENDDVYNIQYIHRNIADVQYMLNNKPVNTEKYETLRKQHIKGTLSLDHWKQAIFTTDRENSRRRERIQILQTYRDISVEQMRNFAITTQEIFKNHENCNIEMQNKLFSDFINTYEQIRSFINNIMRKELGCLGANVYDIISERENRYIWIRT